MRDPGDENDSIEARLDALWAAKQAGFLDQAVKLKAQYIELRRKHQKEEA
jgi:hypothetical protein